MADPTSLHPVPGLTGPNPLAQNISSSISTLAAEDLSPSDDETEITLIDSLYENSDLEGEEEEEDDDEDEVVVIPAKRKRGQRKQLKVADAPSAPRQIEYTTSIYTSEQMAKAKSSRGPPTSNFFKFYSNEPWSALKSRLRTNIRAALELTSIQLDDYFITFTVPRQVTFPITLDDADKYEHLISNALKIKISPSAKILIEPKLNRLPIQKENDDDGSKGKKGVKKTKIRNERDILPANEALNAKIGALRERWTCPTPDGRCGSEHFFVHPDEPEHFPLGHAHFESWGAAMLKGEQFATINKPPNNEHFDKLSPKLLPPAPPFSNININFPPELVSMFGRPPAPAPDPAPVAAAAPVHGPAMLIPSGCAAGPSLSVEDFCAQYDLDDEICARFRQHKFKKTNSFSYITLAQLTTMEFLAGEIAELQVAIAQWAVPSA
ncbi:hypothetical protein DFH08DRAFT_979577 [Mycena albidolilacea]|uniref:Uncharacterized protein n=1 Tax=Mycena albidolilacea TaxID=1033008 RepID=A0AAD6YWE2_9AGAR|nr:hypothetical protein DFH08DRAFT_979577 [Mycena albidolilacea]